MYSVVCNSFYILKTCCGKSMIGYLFPFCTCLFGLWVVFSLKNQPPNMSWINHLYILVLRFASLLGFMQELTNNYPYNLFYALIHRQIYTYLWWTLIPLAAGVGKEALCTKPNSYLLDSSNNDGYLVTVAISDLNEGLHTDRSVSSCPSALLIKKWVKWTVPSKNN